MTEVVKQLIKTLDTARQRSNALGKRDLAMAAGGLLVGAAVGALSIALAASRSRRAAELRADSEAAA
ncbi:MAG: hypothetical protein QM758_03430 [Armatimonas sp.]